jgi:hypothetical protein
MVYISWAVIESEPVIRLVGENDRGAHHLRALQPVLEAYRRRAHLTGALDVR